MIFLLLSGIKSFPAIGLFRNGHFVEFEDEADDEKAVLRWMTAEDTLKGALIYDVWCPPLSLPFSVNGILMLGLL